MASENDNFFIQALIRNLQNNAKLRDELLNTSGFRERMTEIMFGTPETVDAPPAWSFNTGAPVWKIGSIGSIERTQAMEEYQINQFAEANPQIPNDVEFQRLLHNGWFNGNLSTGERIDSRHRLNSYLDYRYGVNFDSFFDYDEYREMVKGGDTP